MADLQYTYPGAGGTSTGYQESTVTTTSNVPAVGGQIKLRLGQQMTIEWTVLGNKTGTSDRVGYVFTTTAYSNDGVTAVVIDTDMTDAQETTNSYNAYVDASGAYVRLNVVGPAATTVSWKVFARYRYL